MERMVENNSPRCLILGGGGIADPSGVRDLLEPGDFVICADSGFYHCASLGVEAGLLVGDFDSLGRRLPGEEGGAPPDGSIPRLTYRPEKNYTDMALAIEAALDRGYRKLVIAGVLGGRLDHTLGNLQSLCALAEKGVDAVMTDGATFLRAVTSGTMTLQSRAGYYFSLFALGGPCRAVTIRGAKYLLDRYDLLPTDPRAVSNEFLEGPVTVSVEEGTLVAACVPMD